MCAWYQSRPVRQYLSTQEILSNNVLSMQSHVSVCSNVNKPFHIEHYWENYEEEKNGFRRFLILTRQTNILPRAGLTLESDLVLKGASSDPPRHLADLTRPHLDVSQVQFPTSPKQKKRQIFEQNTKRWFVFKTDCHNKF